MSDLVLILSVAAITYASRVVLMIRPVPVTGGLVGRFLKVFPLALFISIAASGLLAPLGSPEITPGISAALGGVLGAVLFRRSLWGVLVVGAAVFYATRALVG